MSRTIFKTSNILLFLVFILLILFMRVPASGIHQGVLTQEDSLRLYLRQDASGALLEKACAVQNPDEYVQDDSSQDAWISYNIYSISDTSYHTDSTSQRAIQN